jgi:hypothetical protein
MRRLLFVSVLVATAASLVAVVAASGQSGRTVVCEKTSSKTKPYKRVVVSGKALAAHQKKADDIIAPAGACPKTLLTATTGGVAIDTHLTGVAERPDPGDADGTGTATIRLRKGQAKICYSLSASGITLPAAAAHIHRGTVDEAGAVVVPLGTPNAAGTASGCMPATRPLVAEILGNRSGFYVNVHTSDLPNGALRAQLALPAGTMLLKADPMTGANERPGAADADGAGLGMFMFTPDSGRLCYTLAARNIILPAVGAHIHRGTADVAGPVVIPFTNPSAAGTSSGCVTADAALLRDIAANPGGFYANIHASDFPGGAIRAQLVAVT